MIRGAILFDMDGTLVQTRQASWELFAQTSKAFGLGIDDRESFFRLFEQNFFRGLADAVRDAEKFEAAKAHFLGLLRTRYQPELIPGMVDVIKQLAPHYTLAVLSTNTIATIRNVLTRAGIATCFAHVFAGDVEPDKTVSIARFLSDRGYGFGRACSPAYREQDAPQQPTADNVVLVTDTVGDVKEALHAGIRAIGVSWGMHTEQQLLEAGAQAVALWPQELISWLLPEGAQAEACACQLGRPGQGPCTGHGHDGLAARVAAAAQIRRARRTRPSALRTPPAAARPVPAPRPLASAARQDDVLLRAIRRIL